ncbi:MAG: type II secretion system protein GspJ [Candidatus Omnitrophota bacterium]
MKILRYKLKNLAKRFLKTKKGSLFCTASQRGKSLTGLTFIELLLATVMISILSIALYGVLSNGITIWQKVNQETPQIDINIFAQKLETELRNCVYFKKIPFTGQGNMLSFPSLVNTAVGENGFSQGIGEVTYSFDEQEKAIKREYTDYSFLNSLKSPEQRVLVNNIQELRFAYYFFSKDKQQFFWSDSWPPPDVKEYLSIYPQAIKLTMVLDMGRTTQTRTKTLNIPAGGLLR